MGGSSKKQTVGYKIFVDQQLVVCAGPIDGILRLTWDGKEAWSGWSAGGRVVINKPKLFGGEKREGGVAGDIDLCPGGPDQMPNDRLVAKLGALVNAARGAATLVLRDLYVGLNPYLKRPAVRAQRIHVRQQEGLAQWYDEKAAIPSGLTYTVTIPGAVLYEDLALQGDVYIGPPTTPGAYWLIDGLDPEDVLSITVPGGLTYEAWSRWPSDGSNGGLTWENGFWVTTDDDVTTPYLDSYPATTTYFATAAEAAAYAAAQPASLLTGSATYRIHFNDWVVNLNRGGLSLRVERLARDIEMAVLDMNPAHIIREAWTDPRMSMGVPDADVDDVALTAAADLFYEEGFGLSVQWSEEQPIGDFIDDICRHVDAEWYVDRRTGKLTLKPIRNDYDPETLMVLDRNNTDAVENLVQPLPGELLNSITVQFWNEAAVKDGTVTVNNDALVQMQGGVNGKTVKYGAITHRALAARVAARDLRVSGAPLRACTVRANRRASGLNKGHAFKLNRPEVGLNNVVMRVVDIDFGDGRDNRVTINCVEDVFQMPALPMVSVGDGEGQGPVQAPAAAPARLVTEAPYLYLVRAAGQRQTDEELAYFPEASYLMVAAQRPSADAIHAGLAVDAGAGYEETATIDFSPVATLAADVGQLDTLLTISGAVDLEDVAVGSLAQVGDELLRVDAIDVGAGTITVGRGCLDTVPDLHFGGDRIWFLDLAADGDEVQHAAGDVLDVRVLPETGQGQLELADAPADSVTLAGRAILPYPPGDLKFNGEYFPAIVTGALVLTWAHRDRALQTSGTLYDFTAGDIGPEPGTTYTLEIREGVAVVESASGVAGATWTSALTGTRNVEVTLYSVRDGFASWQSHVHNLTILNDEYLLHEPGEFRMGEDGTLRHPE